jgi:hypothetical protein
MTITRVRRIPFVKAQIVLAASLMAALQSAPATFQANALAVSQQGDNAAEYIGIIEQVGTQFRAVGFLTHIRGLEPAALFTGPASESTARFTFSAAATIVNHAQVGSTVQIGAPGQLSVYFNPAAGATFANPASFAAGTEVVRMDIRFQNVLSILIPNLGVASGTAFGSQTAAPAFTLNGNPTQLGHVGLRHRFVFFGKGTRTDPVTPASTTEFAASSITD